MANPVKRKIAQVVLPEDVYDAVKAAATKEGVPMTEIVRRILIHVVRTLRLPLA